MLLVGLTGNIAAGKSTVAQAFANAGAVIVDSDSAARDAVAPGTPALAQIIERFGSDMLKQDGSLDRARLGAHVFSRPDERRTLEQIVHPAVEAARQRAVRAERARGTPVVVCDIPLLFEAKLAFQFPRIVLVDAPADTRVARLVVHRQMAPDAARARVASQLPAALKRGRADLVLDNDADLPTLTRRIASAWARIERWAEHSALRAATTAD
jgi:dephospho-CoA kinase